MMRRSSDQFVPKDSHDPNRLLTFRQLAQVLPREDGREGTMSRQGAIRAHDYLIDKLKRLFLADPYIREYLLNNNLVEPDDAADILRHRDDSD
jgi:hypothetical protein